jgi:lysozyme
MDLIEQLKRDEGVRSVVYNDSMGIPTIGVGRNLRDVGLSKDEIDLLLNNDIKRVTAQLEQFDWFNGMDYVRQAALMNMCFNVGLASLMHFPTMLHCLSVKDWSGAAAAALDSKWATQVGDRAHRVAQQILTGEWQ